MSFRTKQKRHYTDRVMRTYSTQGTFCLKITSTVCSQSGSSFRTPCRPPTSLSVTRIRRTPRCCGSARMNIPRTDRDCIVCSVPEECYSIQCCLCIPRGTSVPVLLLPNLLWASQEYLPTTLTWLRPQKLQEGAHYTLTGQWLTRVLSQTFYSLVELV